MKYYLAWAVVVILSLGLAGALTFSVYHDTHSWGQVGLTWGALGAILAFCGAMVWAILAVGEGRHGPK